MKIVRVELDLKSSSMCNFYMEEDHNNPLFAFEFDDPVKEHLEDIENQVLLFNETYGRK